ncbi:hypothetical protein TcasGA2_TC010797 [Tribolium castaneum]|uniref:Uncharacterized protein n=1 Tax=Tribolium castaneum TaxID=7070 RepID=D6W7L6_TRICA|nr:hypothetical protein TcasGA2_TC010797 [Tribolium castaneum]
MAKKFPPPSQTTPKIRPSKGENINLLHQNLLMAVLSTLNVDETSQNLWLLIRFWKPQKFALRRLATFTICTFVNHDRFRVIIN